MTVLQNEIHTWHLRNYPAFDAESALLEIGEKLGALYQIEPDPQ